jgi:hypothetical protein
LLRDEQFGFRPRHSTALQLGRLVERVNRNFDETRMTGAVFLDVAKAFDTVRVKGLLYKLTILNFLSYLVKTLSYLHSRTFQSSFNSATSTRRNMRAGVAQGGLVSPVLFSLYIKEMPAPSRHVELALYADDTALIATSRSTLLLVSYLETYLNRLELWLRDWRIAINVSKSTEVPSAKAIPSLWVKLPYIQPTKVLFVKDKLPDGSVFSPVSIALVWTCQGPQPRQQTR